MNNEDEIQIDVMHKKFAVELFNKTWTLLEKENRTIEENDEMIHAAHASRYHWGQIGQPIHFERGEWQISRVYAVLDHKQSALYHAKRCLEICQENDITDFDIAFAYEAMCRAYALLQDDGNYLKYKKLAQEAGEEISKEEDKDYFFTQLKTIEK
jgi:hypothetical protein